MTHDETYDSFLLCQRGAKSLRHLPEAVAAAGIAHLTEPLVVEP